MFFFFFSSRRRHTRWPRDWSSDVCSSDLVSHLRIGQGAARGAPHQVTAGLPGLDQQLGQIDAVQNRVEVAHEVQRRGDRVSVQAVQGTESACDLVVGETLLQLAREFDAADEVETWEQ